jgi:hypothetical protein
LLTHAIRLADDFARLNTGKSSAAKMPMMAMTTSSSIKVNPRFTSSWEVKFYFGSRQWQMSFLDSAGHFCSFGNLWQILISNRESGPLKASSQIFG